MEVFKKYEPGPSPLDNNDPPVKLEHLLPQPGRNCLAIPITSGPSYYTQIATEFLDTEVADPCSAIHDAITLPPDPVFAKPPDPEDKKAVKEHNKTKLDSPQLLKTSAEVYEAAKLYLKCPLDFAINVRYPGQLTQHNDFLGDHRVTLYCTKIGYKETERVLMAIKWIGANTLKGIEERGYVHP
jgi:hypothetical protein